MYVTGPAAVPPNAESTSLPEHLAWAIALAVAFSLILAAIEISGEAKKPLRPCLISQSLFYSLLLMFGNVITTLLAAPLVAKMSPSLSPYYFLFAAFFGIFAFETILKNTNVTVLDKGVLTIQDWIKKAKTAAAAAAIERDIALRDIYRGQLATRLSRVADARLNAFVALKLPPKAGPNIVPELDAAAHANSADPKFYKAYAVVIAVPKSEVLAFIKGSQ